MRHFVNLVAFFLKFGSLHMLHECSYFEMESVYQRLRFETSFLKMPRRKLTNAEANRAIGMLQGGLTQVVVAERLQVSQSVISRLWNRFRETGSVLERPRLGGRRKTTPAQDRFITVSARRNPTSTCRMLRNTLQNADGVQVSIETIRRRLREVNLGSRRPLRGVPLTRDHKRQRLEWARQHINWNDHWRSVLFTDESRYGRFSDSRRIRVWTIPRIPRNRRYVQEVHPFRGGSVMVWAGICFNGRTDLHICPGNMTALHYREHVIDNVVPNFHAAIGETFQFLDDNARPHRAAIVENAREELGIPHLPIPPHSPDLNCIEHAWDMLQRRLDNHQPTPESLNDLRELLPRLWNQIPQEMFNNLVCSMQRRCQAVIDARGGHTLY